MLLLPDELAKRFYISFRISPTQTWAMHRVILAPILGSSVTKKKSFLPRAKVNILNTNRKRKDI